MRTLNVSGQEECRWCIDGLAEIGTRPEGHGHVPMFAPCPYCEAGFRLEFPESGKGRWPNGYWQGRDFAREIVPPAKSGAPLTREQNLVWARKLSEALAGVKGVA